MLCRTYSNAYSYDFWKVKCENGYYGDRIAKCVYEEDLSEPRIDLIELDGCKKVKTKPSMKMKY